MDSATLPFNLPLELAALRSLLDSNQSVRHLSDMRGMYQDQEAVAAILSERDPLIYEFVELANQTSSATLSFGLTRIHPGKVGQEYHMTRGHFHATDGDEIYVVLDGRGILVLQTRDGRGQELPMTPGGLCYIPAGWAHRTVNVGDEDFLFLSVWSATIEHDYQTIEHRGFPQLIVASRAGPEVIRNVRYVTS
jgi:glucose-6-phosphate isomerase